MNTTQTAAQKSAYNNAQVMLGFAEGKPVQWQFIDAYKKDYWHDVLEKKGWNFDLYNYRLRPTPTVKPWDFETCPVGAVVSCKSTDRRQVITEAHPSYAILGVGNKYDWLKLLEEFTLADGAPCGITEGQE